MATLVSFHAHPDDEAIATGGTLAKASADGQRVVLVVATRGERGEVPEGFLTAGEQLADRRVVETHVAAKALGIDRVEFLGYTDSGMMGEPTNQDPDSFWQASIDDAAERLAAILRAEDADVLTIYDDHGTYGHPDHIQVHRVGRRAAHLAGTARVYEATMNRDHLQRLIRTADDSAMDLPDLPDADSFDGFGTSEDQITAAIDVSDYLGAKRAAMAAHASQIGDTSLFLALPPEAFAATWGLEWFVRPSWPTRPLRSSLFDDDSCWASVPGAWQPSPALLESEG